MVKVLKRPCRAIEPVQTMARSHPDIPLAVGTNGEDGAVTDGCGHTRIRSEGFKTPCEIVKSLKPIMGSEPEGAVLILSAADKKTCESRFRFVPRFVKISHFVAVISEYAASSNQPEHSVSPAMDLERPRGGPDPFECHPQVGLGEPQLLVLNSE